MIVKLTRGSILIINKQDFGSVRYFLAPKIEED
jgi:hypothetical protein